MPAASSPTPASTPKGWTREQAIAYGIPRSEVDRYVVMPGQACSYKIGQLKMVAEHVAAAGQDGRLLGSGGKVIAKGIRGAGDELRVRLHEPLAVADDAGLDRAASGRRERR